MKYFVANWKAYINSEKEAEKFIEIILNEKLSLSTDKIIIAPPFVYLPLLKKLLERTVIELAGQNVFWAKGSFTGEVSSEMLAELANFVIIGHSERRKLGEGNREVNKKVKAALGAGLRPIICVGERLEDYQKGKIEIASWQIRQAIKELSLSDIEKTIVAYEPIWAIGSDEAATLSHCQRVIYQIRQEIASTYGRETGRKVLVLYGGSVNKDNTSLFLKEKEIGGLLIGRASANPQDFIKIIKGKE